MNRRKGHKKAREARKKGGVGGGGDGWKPGNSTFPILVVETLVRFSFPSLSMLTSKTFMPKQTLETNTKGSWRVAIRAFTKRLRFNMLCFSGGVSTNYDLDCVPGHTYIHTYILYWLSQSFPSLLFQWKTFMPKQTRETNIEGGEGGKQHVFSWTD